MQSSSNLWNRKGQSALSLCPLFLTSAPQLSGASITTVSAEREAGWYGTARNSTHSSLPLLGEMSDSHRGSLGGWESGGRGCFMLIDPAAELMFTCASPERRCSNACKPSHPSTSTFTAATAAHTRPVCRCRQLTRKQSVSSNCYINYVTLCVFHISPLGALDDTLIYCTESAGW